MFPRSGVGTLILDACASLRFSRSIVALPTQSVKADIPTQEHRNESQVLFCLQVITHSTVLGLKKPANDQLSGPPSVPMLMTAAGQTFWISAPTAGSKSTSQISPRLGIGTVAMQVILAERFKSS